MEIALEAHLRDHGASQREVARPFLAREARELEVVREDGDGLRELEVVRHLVDALGAFLEQLHSIRFGVQEHDLPLDREFARQRDDLVGQRLQLAALGDGGLDVEQQELELGTEPVNRLERGSQLGNSGF